MRIDAPARGARQHRPVVDSTRIHGPRQLTDIYLLALAVENNATFVTFDTGIPLAAVRKATANNLTVL